MFTRVCEVHVQLVLGVPFSAVCRENTPVTLQGNQFLALKAVLVLRSIYWLRVLTIHAMATVTLGIVIIESTRLVMSMPLSHFCVNSL